MACTAVSVMNSDCVKNWPKNERPRERLLAEGAEKVSDADLLAIVLRVGKGTFKKGVQGQNVSAFARSLIAQFGSLRALDRARIQDLLKELADYRKRMNDRITTETRALLKERFPYPIFLYEAEKVGITATGEQDQNELYPNDNLPPEVTRTAVELYQDFRRDPTPFFIEETTK